MPVISAVGTGRYKKGELRRAPLSKFEATTRSRDRGSAGCPLHVAGVETPRTDLHLRGLPVDQDADDLKVPLPHATRAVVRVRDVVPEGHASAARVAATAIDGHDVNPLGS